MDNLRSPLLNWPCFFQGKSMEELTQTLLLTTLELETTRLRAQEEMRMRDDQLLELRDMLEKVIRDRDEAQEKCQKLFFDKLLLQQHQLQLQLQPQQYQAAPHSGISSIEDDPIRGLDPDSNNGFSSSDCEESIVSSPIIDPPIQENDQEFFPLVPDKPLPEKGKLLQAVMKAGPLLQTLLLAGPLPQWRHPPPPLDTYQIPPPPVVVPSPPPPPPQSQFLHQDSFLNVTTFSNNSINSCGRLNRKRGFCEGSDSSTETKFQRVVLN